VCDLLREEHLALPCTIESAEFAVGALIVAEDVGVGIEGGCLLGHDALSAAHGCCGEEEEVRGMKGGRAMKRGRGRGATQWRGETAEKAVSKGRATER
jgi:hypothetical protein